MKKIYIISIIIVVLSGFLKSCITLRKSDESVIKNFKKENQVPEIFHDNYDGVSIRYISDKPIDKTLPTIIFVHGAPGSSDNFYKHLQDLDFREKANLVSVDRLGYGYSNYGKAEISIEKQAKMIDYVAQKYNHKKIILVGWSYGGPIIGKMAIDNPSYAHLVMIAPAVSADDEKLFWFGNFAKWKATKWMSPKPFVVAENEKLSHAKELKKIEPEWKKLKTPVSYFHGTKDGLVTYKNMAFMKRNMDKKYLKTYTIEGGNHTIIFDNYDFIKKKILKVVNAL